VWYIHPRTIRRGYNFVVSVWHEPDIKQKWIQGSTSLLQLACQFLVVDLYANPRCDHACTCDHINATDWLGKLVSDWVSEQIWRPTRHIIRHFWPVFPSNRLQRHLQTNLQQPTEITRNKKNPTPNKQRKGRKPKLNQNVQFKCVIEQDRSTQHSAEHVGSTNLPCYSPDTHHWTDLWNDLAQSPRCYAVPTASLHTTLVPTYDHGWTGDDWVTLSSFHTFQKKTIMYQMETSQNENQ